MNHSGSKQGGDTMTDSSMTLSEYLNKVGVDPNGDFLREGLRLLAQLTMELEVSLAGSGTGVDVGSGVP
jgi:hypothetical protein